MSDKMSDRGGKIVCNGVLEVFPDGAIWRLSRGKWVKCPVYIAGPSKIYPYVTAQVDGRQKNLLAHRVIAEAFIDNPGNLPYVEQIDGDPLNLDVSNLRWISNRQRLEKVKRTYSKNRLRCEKCGNEFHISSVACPCCARQEVRSRGIEKRKLQKLEKIAEEFRDVDVSRLAPDRAKAVEMRLGGATLEMIGNELGVTREGARQILKKVVAPPEPCWEKTESLFASKEHDSLRFHVARNLKKMLSERNLRIIKVAEDTGIGKSSLSKIGRGRARTISFETLEILSAYLGVPVAAFFEIKQEPASSANETSS